jgi:hypothetical protein
MAITASRMLTLEPTTASSIMDIEVTNALQTYGGGFYFVDTATGYLVAPADTSTFKWAGIVQRNALGDTAASPKVKAQLTTGPMVLRNYPVTGTTAITNQFTYVYCTDNATLDINATSNTKPVGHVLKWYTGTTCDVQLYAPEVSRAS